jgi:hypothetical protein
MLWKSKRKTVKTPRFWFTKGDQLANITGTWSLMIPTTAWYEVVEVKPETSFRKTQVIPFLKALPNTVFFPVQQIAISGTPDFLLCISGTFVALELKSKNGKLSRLQEYFLERVSKARGVSILASPETWEEDKKRLRQLAGGEKDDQDHLQPNQ